jgi:hypothetical protein
MGQSLPTKNFKTDFGAKGDGASDDSEAWSRAVKYFNEKGGGKLNIPKGIYRVGTQVFDKDSANKIAFARPKFSDVFNGIDNLQIVGTVGKNGKITSVFKFHDGIKYGFFNPVTGEKPKGTGVDTQASLGGLMTFSHSCKNIVVKNLELDGNIPKGTYYAPPTGMRGPDLVFIGIVSYGARNLLIENVYTHHFGLDGLYIQTPREALADGKYYTTLSKCRSEYNGRQGLSYTVGSHLKVINSSFKFTGMGGIRIAPGANVDIENQDKTHKALSEILFENCVISANKGGSGSVNIAGNVDNIVFKNCMINAGKKIPGTNRFYAVQMNFSPSRNVSFEQCELTGSFLMYRKDKVMDAEGTTRFTDCVIKDNSILGDAQSKQPLLDIYDNAVFENCTFHINESRKLVQSSTTLLRSNARAISTPVIFKGCKVVDLKTKRVFKDEAKFESARVKFQK